MIPTPSLTYTPKEKKHFFKLMDRMIGMANSYGNPKPKTSTIARLNDLYWIKQVLQPETLEAKELIAEWMLQCTTQKEVYIERHEKIYKSKINFAA